ncbi:capping protein-inhibiting regulator of actin dynamics isoform X3 [Dunckerocampus dactyliophorus]|uniref:capping protein-inhibiting regulator of actin dynamics isoform X3 n=1 Tax=Dunckerocampus dactyliophorus TaxID=161453 RepID=UPI002405F93B|nr:capping protein-inhibiting regulator of actin dynamics isoform X3 [Dunckerocampus dactyliophorus]
MDASRAKKTTLVIYAGSPLLFTMKRRMSPWGAGFGSGRSSDAAAMASGPPDVMANQESAEVVEECSGKKKSKFQTFKNFFARKKKKEAPSSGDHTELKGSQSSDNISKTSENNALCRSEKERGSGSKISLGSKALSHDSVFVSDSSEANEALGASQDSIHGKVKSLQLQLKQAIRLGSPPSLMCVKRAEDGGTMSEDDGLPCSPPEYTSPHTALAQRNSSISLEVTDSDEDQLSRAGSPLVSVPGDFSQPASPFGCLDNSAAKHKLGLRQKACNRRKPANRIEVKAEEHHGINGSLNIPFPESLEAQEDEKMTDASEDEQDQKMEKEEEKSLLQDEQESMEGEDELEAEQDMSHGQDTSCQSQEGAPPSPKRSTTSSLDSPRASPEPPTGQKNLLAQPLAACGTEENIDGLGQAVEEDGSFLQEVLNSLPSRSSCVDSDDVVLEMKEDDQEPKEEEEKEVTDEEPVFHRDAPSDALLLGHTTEEEEEEEAPQSAPLSLYANEEEESEDNEEEDEEEELVVERFSQPCLEDKGDKVLPQEEKPEKQDWLQRRPDQQEEQEAITSDEDVQEEEATELEEKEEGGELREEEEMEEKQQIAEGMTPDAAGRDVCKAPQLQEEVEGAEALAGDDAICNAQFTHGKDGTPPEWSGAVHENQATSRENDDYERNDGKDEAAEDEDLNMHSEGEDDLEVKQDMDEDLEQEETEAAQTRSHMTSFSLHFESSSRENAIPLSETITPTEIIPLSETITPTEIIPPSETTTPIETITPTESISPRETITPTEAIPPSETITSIETISTTTIHRNPVSPNCETGGTLALHLSPTDEESSPSYFITTEHVEEAADRVIEAVADEDQVSDATAVVDGASPPSPEEEGGEDLSLGGSDQSKTRFTIAPAWQRSLSGGDSKDTPFSFQPPDTGPGDEDSEASIKKDLLVDAQPAALVVVTSGNTKVAGGPAVKPPRTVSQDPVRAQTTAVAAKEESSVVVEGSYDTPFGVRLRKTAVLHSFSSEVENTEAPAELPAQPVSSKVEATASFKHSISPPISNKPALPKKPDVHGDSGVKPKRVTEPAAVRGVSTGSECPSWISVARQKQKTYKENSLDEMTVKKEEQEQKSPLPTYVSSAAKKELSNTAPEFTGKVSLSEISKLSSSTEKETRKSLPPPTPVPPQPPKSQPLACAVTPKPLAPLVTPKPAPQPASSHRSLSSSTPVPLKSPTSANPPALSKTTPSPKPTLASPPFSSRINPPLPGPRAPALSSPSPISQRGLPPPSLPQDEPPWMALAKKKAKAWSEMPQIVQ